MLILGAVFGVAICCVSAYCGLAFKNEETVQSFGLAWLFPLTFVSSAFVPVNSMPGWLQVFAKHQPVTIVINEMRSLALGGPAIRGGIESVLWLIAIIAVFIPLAVRSYRRV